MNQIFSKENRKKPSFLIIGAAKAGTTSLYDYLKQHPQVFMSPVKETNFFAFENIRPSFNGPGSESFNKEAIIYLDEYLDLFSDVENEVAIGEASPSYMHVPRAPRNIHQHIPDVKLIAILRDPVDRAYSSFMHLVREDKVKNSDFADTLKLEETLIEKNWGFLWRYKTLGLYYKHLKPYFDLFPREQIRVYLYDDLVQNPLALMQEIYDFVGVNRKFIPNTSIKYNVTGSPINRALYEFLRKPNLVKSGLRVFIPDSIRHPIVNQLKIMSLKKESLDPKVRKSLINAFRDDILSLEQLIDRDLSKWLE